jgi:hypothetical protein
MLRPSPRRNSTPCGGGIWNLTRQSGNREARAVAIEEAGNCPSGRLVVWDKKTGKAIEPEFEKSIVVIEYPPRSEQGPLRVRGGITLNHLMVMSMKSGTG